MRTSLLALTTLIGLGTAPGALAQSPQEVEALLPSTGRIAGVVAETDGTPVPGAFVLVEGPTPLHEQFEARADERGAFTFDDLEPGTYRLAVELPGLNAPSDAEVVVPAGTTVHTRVVLSLFAYEARVQVLASTPDEPRILDTESTSRLRTLSNRALARLPLPAEQALEVLPVFPGIVRGPQGLISIGGTLPTNSVFLFNGADLMDTYSGHYRLRVPLEAVERVRLESGVVPASYGDQLGGVVDLTTAGGGDRWSFEVGSPIPRPWFRKGGLRGIKRFNPRIRVSGPLVHDRVFVSQSLGYHINKSRIRDVPAGASDHIRTEGLDTLTQLDFKIGRVHQLRAMFLATPQDDDFVGLNGLTPAESTRMVDRRSRAGLVEHQARVDDASFLRTTIQFNRIGLESEVHDPSRTDPFRVGTDQVNGPYFHLEDRRARHFQIKSTYTRAIGGFEPRHLLQLGFEVHRVSLQGSQRNRTIQVRGVEGQLLRRIDFSEAPALDGGKTEWALYVQERFKPSDRFWIDAGLRLSRDYATSDPHLAPRFGAAWDPFGNTATLVKASIGLLYQRVLLGEHLWSLQPTRTEIRYSEDGSASVHSFRPELGTDPDPPRALLGTIEVSHRFSDRFAVLARYSQRETRHRWVFDLIPGTGIPLQPGQDPASVPIRPEQQGRLLLDSTGRDTYRELELTANLRIGDRHQLFFSYTRSSATGDLNEFGLVAGEGPEPVLRNNARGPLPFETPNRLVIWGSWYLPSRIILSPVIEWRNGFPFSVLAEDQDYLGQPNRDRFPTYVSADVNITKGFQLRGRPLRAGIQLRNLTGHFNPRDVIANRASPRFRQFLNSAGLRFRLRFSATF